MAKNRGKPVLDHAGPSPSAYLGQAVTKALNLLLLLRKQAEGFTLGCSKIFSQNCGLTFWPLQLRVSPTTFHSKLEVECSFTIEMELSSWNASNLLISFFYKRKSKKVVQIFFWSLQIIRKAPQKAKLCSVCPNSSCWGLLKLLGNVGRFAFIFIWDITFKTENRYRT